MRRLAGGIPRAMRSHRGADGAAYRAYTAAMLTRLGPFDRAAMVSLREAGLVTLELARAQRELEQARSKTNRRREERRLRRAAASLRSQLIGLERRLEELAASGRRAPTSGAELVAGARVQTSGLTASASANGEARR